ncbi:ionotropic receptor 75a-like [Sitophilus oryzae]|uniref:Ionotropic receptor 75a-like n=1 Tax=Sitophilus oryzae TaxID=7048 RepID=A0A6J2YYN3_SITOR|nr:ionotropic receptor 75a-like [Sitophilus oryzae]
MLPANIKNLEYPIPPYGMYFVLPTSCLQGSPKLLQIVDEFHLFSSPFRWLLLSDNAILKNIIDNMRNLSILVDSDLNLAETMQDDRIIIRKIYKKHIKSSEFLVEDYGSWEKGLKFRKNENFEIITARRRKKLNIQLDTSVVITHQDSLNHLTDKRDKHIDSISKVCYVLVIDLASIYNISLNITYKDTWGYKNNKSEWSGMMGMLTRKEADIGGTSLFLTRERVDLIDYIAMITPTRSKFVFRQPKLSYITNVFVLPFDTKVWISTAVLIIIMIVSLFVLMKWEWKKKTITTVQNTSNSIELSDSFMEIVLLTLAALSQQGAAAMPSSTPGRIATIVLLIALMFMYVSYSANIVALLQTSSNSIKTLEDLLNSRITIGVDDTVYNHFYFSTAEEPIRKAIYEKKVAPPGKPANYMPLEVGVRKMREGLFAFHMETGSGYKLVSEIFREDEKCGLQEIAYIQVVDPWFAIQKNSSYKEMLKIGLRLLQENGMQERENILIYTRKPVCTSKTSTFISVGIIDCYSAAVILAGGMIASIIVLILEVYVHKRMKFYKDHWKGHFNNSRE